MASANTNGVDGGCSGGADTNAYSVPLTTATNNAVVYYGAVAMRNRSHTPGAGYTEQVEINQGSSGSGTAVEDQEFSTVSIVNVDGYSVTRLIGRWWP